MIYVFRALKYMPGIFPSEARPKAELRSPEAELFSSLRNWVGNRKKVDKKKGTTTTTTTTGITFFAPPISLANFKKMSVFEENLKILKHNFYFLRKRKISGFCYFL